MASHTIKVTGVSDELLRLLDERIQAQHSTGRSEYIRELIRRDLLGGPVHANLQRPRSFREILAPVYEETQRQGVSNDEIDHDIEEAIRETRAERRKTEAS